MSFRGNVLQALASIDGFEAVDRGEALTVRRPRMRS